MALAKTKHPIIVQKYGGSSVATPKSIKEVATLIKKCRDSGNLVCVIVSAMGKTTDQLVQTAKEIAKNPSRRELDMLLSCGERASMSLLAMALHELDVPCISFTGSQSGIITDNVHSGAKILEVRPSRVLKELESDKVVIIAGFQGVSQKKEITTLGRGGSDTTAIAMTAALNAKACEIYSDVCGVYTADPKLVPDAQLLKAVSFDEMEELATFGAKVLNSQAILFAKQKGITFFTRKTGTPYQETIVGNIDIPKNRTVTAIAHQDSLQRICINSIDKLDTLLSDLETQGITPNHIFNQKEDSFWCLIDVKHNQVQESVLSNFEVTDADKNWGSVSIIGHDLFSSSIYTKAIKILKEQHTNIEGSTSSSLRLTFIIKKESVKNALSLLHKEFIEDIASKSNL